MIQTRARRIAVLSATSCLLLTLGCGRAGVSDQFGQPVSAARTGSPIAPSDQAASPTRTATPSAPSSAASPATIQVSCSSTPGGRPLALGWPAGDPNLTVLIDLSDIAKPRTLCTLTNANSLVRFQSATQISYAPYFGSTTSDGSASTLMKRDLAKQVTQTFAAAHAWRVEGWDWSPDGTTLAYFADGQLWLRARNQAAVSVSSYKMQGGRGGGWSDEIIVRFSPSGKYFVAVHTVTVPLTFEIRRASDASLVWSLPSPDGAPGWPTMAVWARDVDRLLFRDGNGVRAWDPSGAVTTLIPGLNWIAPSISPDGNKIAYTVLDPTTFHLRVEMVDLRTLQVRLLSPDRWNVMFASDDLVLFGRAQVQFPGNGTLAYDLKTGMQSEFPLDMLLDVLPR